MMTRTEWYAREREAVAGIQLMEDSGWAVRAFLAYSGSNNIANFVVVFERDTEKRAGWDNER